MKLALVLFHYFPYGGLERDMLAIARQAVSRGHEVTVFTAAWEGERPEGIEVVVLPVRGLGNHVQVRRFAARCAEAIEVLRPDCVFGFNRMPGLDFYFAADTCYARKVDEQRGWLYRQLPRCRQYLAFEEAVYGQSATTRILALTPAQISDFQRYYGTPTERFHLLPPGIRRDRVMPADYAARRLALRADFGLAADQRVLLMVGSNYQRKGLDRAIAALAALPAEQRAGLQLWVVGKGERSPFEKLAQDLGVAEQVKILGARDDVPELLWAADLLLHPAYSEAAGAVLIEAMVAGLPVVTTAVCGYAPWIESAGMGRVVAHAAALAAAISEVLEVDADHWRAQARALIARNEVFSMHEEALRQVEIHCSAATRI